MLFFGVTAQWSHQLSKSALCTLRYANGSFDDSTLKDLDLIVGAIEIKF